MAESVEASPVAYRGAGITVRGDLWRVQYDAAGTVVLLHGAGQTRHSWHRAGARLAAHGWTTLALDARGHGDSDWAPDANYRVAAQVADLRAAVVDLGSDGLGGKRGLGANRGASRPVLVGASMGGFTALSATAADSGFARALVLVDVVPAPEPVGLDRVNDFMRAHRNGFASLAEVATAIAAYNPRRSHPPTPEGLRKNVRLHADQRWYWHWDPALLEGASGDGREAVRARMTADAKRVRVPTLLIRGTDSDVVSEAGVRGLLNLIPSASYLDVTGAGHMVAGDDNDVFGACVLDFLQSLPSTV